MDGPNVNLALEKELKKIYAELNLPLLIELGTCGLHTVHRAFQTGAKATNWDLDNFLKKEYKLFKDSPARSLLNCACLHYMHESCMQACMLHACHMHAVHA